MAGSILLGISLLVVCGTVAYATMARVAMSSKTLEQLVARLKSTELTGITYLAFEVENLRRSELRTEPEERFAMVGGWKGVWALYSNAQILLNMAGLLEHLYPEVSGMLVDQLRADALVLRGAPSRILLDRLGYYGKTRTITLQESALAYYRICKHLRETLRTRPDWQTQGLQSALWLGTGC